MHNFKNHQFPPCSPAGEQGGGNKMVSKNKKAPQSGGYSFRKAT